MKNKICQSCAMPFDGCHSDLIAKEKDGSNSIYCVYCFKNGKFTNPKAKAEDIIETGVPHLAKKIGESKARSHLSKVVPALKRWQQFSLHFKYGKKEINHLKNRDKKLAKVIDEYGIIKRELTADPFASLIESIIGQQISGKAAQTVTERFYKLLKNKVTPAAVKKCGIEKIQSCGMSLKKASYIIGIADASLDKSVDFKNLHKLEDQEIIEKLSSLNGVGVWTAEMMLIFTFGKPDVLSYGDLGIRRGIMRLHQLKTLTKKEFEKYKKLYSPYASIASFYLWTVQD